MRNLNIIQATPYFPPHLGGMENCVFEISKKLVQRGYPVSIYTSNIGHGAKYQKSGAKVFRLISLEFAHTPIIFSLFFRLLFVPKKSLIHLHISQALTPELVYLVSILRNIPYVAHVHLDVDASGLFGFFLYPYKKYFLSRVLKKANKIICLSEGQKKIIGRKYNIRPSRIDVVPNGVADEHFVTKNRKNNQVRLLFVGRLSDQKNVSHLINAVSIMKHSVWVDIVGDGEKERELKELIKAKKLKNIKIHGKKTGRSLINFYKNSDLFIITSKKEGFSLATLEAMAAGLPIVGVANPGTRELIRDCGVLVKESSPKALAESIDQLISDTARRRALSSKAVTIAKKYSWDRVVTQLEEVYGKVGYVN